MYLMQIPAENKNTPAAIHRSVQRTYAMITNAQLMCDYSEQLHIEKDCENKEFFPQ